MRGNAQDPLAPAHSPARQRASDAAWDKRSSMRPLSFGLGGAIAAEADYDPWQVQVDPLAALITGEIQLVTKSSCKNRLMSRSDFSLYLHLFDDLE